MIRMTEDYFIDLLIASKEQHFHMRDSFLEEFPNVVQIKIREADFKHIVQDTTDELGEEHPASADGYTGGYQWSCYHPKFVLIGLETVNDGNGKISIEVGFKCASRASLFKLRWHNV